VELVAIVERESNHGREVCISYFEMATRREFEVVRAARRLLTDYVCHAIDSGGDAHSGTGKLVWIDPSGEAQDILVGLVVPSATTIGPDGAICTSNCGAAPPGLGQILGVEAARRSTRSPGERRPAKSWNLGLAGPGACSGCLGKIRSARGQNLRGSKIEDLGDLVPYKGAAESSPNRTYVWMARSLAASKQNLG
jgi:hypothetical protein